MDIQEKAQEYDKMVEIIKEHSIESDGMFAKPFTYSAVLEDVLERYLDNIKQLQNKENKGDEAPQESNDAKKLVEKHDYFVTFQFYTIDNKSVMGGAEYTQYGNFDAFKLSKLIKKEEEKRLNTTIRENVMILFVKDISTEWVEESEIR